ncbi:hypothetical protein [Salinarimonas rosea]|uniref:hypothetical protein n=1 Tax=Salinarimonas rosea TaxID=552063 RepID=UPI00040A0A1D|nr:hypothetical protein [Salinarimonas rosea]
MTHPITLTATLAVAPGKAQAAEAARDRVAEAVAPADDLAFTAGWENGNAILTIRVGAASQAAVDRHLKEHGPLYGAFDGIARVAELRVEGPVDEATLASMRRLTDFVETA